MLSHFFKKGGPQTGRKEKERVNKSLGSHKYFNTPVDSHSLKSHPLVFLRERDDSSDD